MNELCVILYTTKYRTGGDKFQRVAETLGKEKTQAGLNVVCQAIESKREILVVFDKIKKDVDLIAEFHFIGHAGMYGPMYGTVKYPEQFSPYELNNLQIPFAENASAFFHCCRSARWFAPYFARVQQIKTYGYHWYTAFSANKEFYKIDVSNDAHKPLYCFGCPGKKSHGYITSFKKHFGKLYAEKLKEFYPESEIVDDTYQKVAKQYHDVFTDIKVRRDEIRWINKHLPADSNINLLDIGCGNGALLKELSQRIGLGTGVDVSENLLEFARSNNVQNPNIDFKSIQGPDLPFGDNTFDVVISLMSFRYLDWDPIMLEIQRVLKTNGKLLIVDMVTAPVKLTEYPKFMVSKVLHYLERVKNPVFYKNLQKLVSNPAWSNMLQYNPIRSQHEMKWFLESRFPKRKVEVINVGYHSRIIAFDSECMDNVQNLKISYP